VCRFEGGSIYYSGVAIGRKTHKNKLMTVVTPPCGPPSCRPKRRLITLTLSASVIIQLLSLSALPGERKPNSPNGLADAAKGSAQPDAIERTGAVTKPGAALVDGQPGIVFRDRVQPLLRKYCIECHGQETHEGQVNFEAFKDFSAAITDRKTWERARKMLGAGSMPPADHEPRPTSAEKATLVQWIDRAVFDVDCDRTHDPGHVTIRRLNRAEYNNTIRDLVGVSLRPADDFPSDDVGNGFDNMGDVLSLSPLLLEKYLAAAESVSSVALYGFDLKHPPLHQLDNGKLMAKGTARLFRRPYARRKQFSLASFGSVDGTFTAPLAGEYVFCIVASAHQSGDEIAKMRVRIDHKDRETFAVKGELAAARYELRLGLSKGVHTFAVLFANYDPEPPPPALPAKAQNIHNRRSHELVGVRELILDRCEVQGPFRIEPQERSFETVESRKQILFCTPGKDGSPEECATRILSAFATRAFRRPLDPGEIRPYVNLTLAAAKDDPFDRAIQTGLTAILVSPHFLFRVEQPGSPGEGTDPVPIGPYELASRLSYFLWSSMPDDELFRLASDGSLEKPDVLEAQVRRMLVDKKSRALVDNFAVQWLNLTQLDAARPSQRVFEDYDRDLRNLMRRETELFFESIVHEDRSILDLLNGKYTFLNERLAKLYGISGIEGDQFRLVSLKGYPRAGVLTQPSILTLTSQPTRTSPVKRGKWILETFLGSAPPPPPPDVPQLATTIKANPKASLREQMAIHRQSSKCSVCHKVMDPLGFGLENFDGIGRWREKEKGRPVDASGALPGGESFRGPIELVGVLSKRQDAFRRHLARTLLTYALGRGLEYYDACAVDRIVEATRERGDRFSILVNEIVRSEPFLKRRGSGARHGS
jgi:hypothetical protein